ncbi:amidohydrolase [Neobittarella massiliensis]|uniref:Amidohydrolase n=1 Tax=Neobittarella massiliensis (ex Bilen et al. 2018) TaxID=2041842 RepID=A0A8J6ILD1_9FIRM|nr:amidohydrolase [Neobittarella massiliensis]MBC3515604.1 amidohydrolase [Neobittarella massiliensis]
MNYDVLIQNATVLDADMQLHTGWDIGISGQKIAALGPDLAADAAVQLVDGSGKLYMPGLIDGHTHTCQQLLRGRILDELPMIWTRIMLPFESGLDRETVQVSAQLACLEMIKSGTTAFADAGGRFMDEVAQAVADSGLRADLTCSTIDQPGVPATMRADAQQALQNNRQLFARWHQKAQGRLTVSFSLRTLLSCSPQLIAGTFAAAEELGTSVHVHMNEYPGEVNACLEKYKLRPMAYLESLGVLGGRLLAAHCIFVSDSEISLMAARGVRAVHCPFSNSGKGVPPAPRLLEQGIPVGLGTDGAAHGGLSLWNEMKILRSVQNAVNGAATADPAILPAATILHMATAGSAAALGRRHIGRLAPGYQADLIAIDLCQPHILPTADLVHTLVETVTAADVCDSMVAGRWLMRDRQVKTIDEKAVLRRAADLHKRLICN